jgi:lysozyme
MVSMASPRPIPPSRTHALAPLRRSAAFRTALGVTVLATSSACEPVETDRLGASRAALDVCAGANTVLGVDVSYYQGAVDFDELTTGGFGFAIARISDGIDHPDDRFAENWSAIAKAGLVRGAYQFFEPDEDAAAQATLVVNAVGKLGVRDLPVALDLETTSGLAASELAARAEIWLAQVEAGTGKRPLIYSVASFWNRLESDAGGVYPLWVADYGVSCPALPASWTAWTFWQRSGNGRAPGISTAVDLDVFNGTSGELLAFARDASIGPDTGSPLDADTNDATTDDANAVVRERARVDGAPPMVPLPMAQDAAAPREAGSPAPDGSNLVTRPPNGASPANGRSVATCAKKDDCRTGNECAANAPDSTRCAKDGGSTDPNDAATSSANASGAGCRMTTSKGTARPFSYAAICGAVAMVSGLRRRKGRRTGVAGPAR